MKKYIMNDEVNNKKLWEGVLKEEDVPQEAPAGDPSQKLSELVKTYIIRYARKKGMSTMYASNVAADAMTILETMIASGYSMSQRKITNVFFDKLKQRLGIK